MKICCVCKLEKEDKAFSWKNSAKGTRCTMCKVCHKEYSKTHYNNNKQYYCTKARTNRITSKNKLRFLVWSYLQETGCIDCGETDPVLLEFDHVRGTKTSPVSKMVNTGLSLGTVGEEIAKCEVRCANCHKKKTAQQFEYWYVRAGVV